MFADVEVPEERAGWVRQMVRALARAEEFGVAAWLVEEEEEEAVAVRLERLAGALAGQEGTAGALRVPPRVCAEHRTPAIVVLCRGP